jgi:hypothetical protein
MEKVPLERCVFTKVRLEKEYEERVAKKEESRDTEPKRLLVGTSMVPI